MMVDIKLEKILSSIPLMKEPVKLLSTLIPLGLLGVAHAQPAPMIAGTLLEDDKLTPVPFTWIHISDPHDETYDDSMLTNLSGGYLKAFPDSMNGGRIDLNISGYALVPWDPENLVFPDSFFATSNPELLPQDAIRYRTDVGVDGEDDTSLDSQVQFEIFPNPCTDHLSIPYSLPSGQRGSLTIYNIIGQEIKSFDVFGTNIIRWNVRSESGRPIAEGVYLLRFEVPYREPGFREPESRKIVIHRGGE